MVDNPLMRPYFLGGGHWGVPLDSYEVCVGKTLGERDGCFAFLARGRFLVKLPLDMSYMSMYISHIDNLG